MMVDYKGDERGVRARKYARVPSRRYRPRKLTESSFVFLATTTVCPSKKYFSAIKT